MWAIQRTDKLARRVKQIEKRHRSEVKAVFKNLDTYIDSLNQGVKPMQMFKHSFVHKEQMGVHAIDQSPLKKGAKALRLYVFPDPSTSTLHVLTLGGKDEQRDDVNECCGYVKSLQKQAESAPKSEKVREPPPSQAD